MSMDHMGELQQGTGHVSRAESQRLLRRARHRKQALLGLADTLAVLPDPPCDRNGGCQHKAHCATTGDACPAFMLYATQLDSDTAERVPNQELGKRLWNGIELFPQSVRKIIKKAVA